MTPQDRINQLKEKIKKEVERAAGKGLVAATYFAVSRIKEVLSVPAPRRKLPDGTYVATTPALKDAPPRKLSGLLRNSVAHEFDGPLRVLFGASARSKPSRAYPKGFGYGSHWEKENPGHPSSGTHKFIVPTLLAYRDELGTIVGRAVTVEL